MSELQETVYLIFIQKIINLTYKAVLLKEGKDLTIISNGDVLSEGIKQLKSLVKKGIEAEVISVPLSNL